MAIGTELAKVHRSRSEVTLATITNAYFFHLVLPSDLMAWYALFSQIIDLCELKDDARKKAHAIIDKFADRGLRSLAVCRQVFILSFPHAGA